MNKWMRRISLSALCCALIVLVGCKEQVAPPKAPAEVELMIPTDFKATEVTESYVFLTWEGQKDLKDITYRLYQDGNLLVETTRTNHTVFGLNPNTPVSFSVEASLTGGKVSEKSPEILVTLSEKTPVSVENIDKRIVGYYASWAANEGFTPDKLDVSKLTHINYAFANVSTDLKIELGDPSVDESNFQILNELKVTYPHLKTLISIGGWTWSEKFSDVALTQESRDAFADSCVAFVVKYGFDGVDIDWEYPVEGGESDNVKRPEDKQNFTALLKALRDKLDAQGLVDGKKYLVTIAGAASTAFTRNTEMSIYQEYLDFANIMTYDMHGSWEGTTDFNGPFSGDSASKNGTYNLQKAVEEWLAAGFPADKIVLGVPFYGYRYTNVKDINNGMYQAYSGCSYSGYCDVMNSLDTGEGYQRFFNETTMLPWIFNGSVFISYEDQQSIRNKMNYVMENGLGGAMIWELSNDPDAVLLDAVCRGLHR